MAIRLVEHNNSSILLDEDYTVNERDDVFTALDSSNELKIRVKQAGRGSVSFFTHADASMVHKHYLRGGLVSKLIFDQYLWLKLELTRSFVEFRALEEMSQLGLPVPRPIAARVKRSGISYTADLITEKLDNTKTLGDCLYDQSVSEQIFSTIGETIANFHETGCYHPDLNVENILIDESQKVFLLDFDRWKRKEESKRLGVTNIERLKSSIRKRLGLMGLPFPEKEWRGFLATYYSRT